MLNGCAKTEAISLFYSSANPGILPAPNAPTVTVVQFEDRRGNQTSIGLRRDDSPIYTQNSVTTWISQATADELNRMGLQVSYAINPMIANAASPDYTVTGTITQVWVKELSATTYQATIQVGLTVSDRSRVLWNQSFSSTQEKTGLPRMNQVENLLNDTLREILNVAAPKINEAVR